MTPAELLDDHRRRPRAIGKLAKADLVGDVGSIVVGDALRFYLGLDGERIREARFQVFNAADQVAATSVLCELLPGRTLEQALATGPRDLCAHLGGLDPADLPPRLWGLDALRAAIGARQGEPPATDSESEPLLCRCHGIHEETVRQSIAVMDLKDPEAVVGATGAGTACGSCRADLPRLIEEAHRPAAAPPPPKADGATAVAGRIPTLLAIQRAVAGELQPQWQAQGGGLDLWDFDGARLSVKAQGAFAGDEAALRAACEALEQLLRQRIAAGIGVVLLR